MPPRLCVDETCSISPAVDPDNGQLILDVVLDADGGLDCLDGEGLTVKRLGNSAPVAEGSVDLGCVQQIGVTDLGNLFVEDDPITVLNQPAGASVDYTTLNTDHASFTAVVTNPFTCPVWCRFVAGQPQIVTRIDVSSAVESPGGSGRYRCYRQGFAYLNSTVADVNGQNRITTRSDLMIRVAAGEDDLELQKNDLLHMLVPLNGGQSTTFEVGIRHSVMQGFRTAQANGASFTAQRLHVEMFKR